MKILISTTYIYDPAMPEFTKNKTGFGMMVRDIFASVSEKEEVYLISNVLTSGHGQSILKHTLLDVLKSARLGDWFLGIKWFLKYKQNIKGRMQYIYYGVNRGYIRKTVRRIHPDLVHIHGISQSAKVCMNVCEELGVPYIITLHGLIGLDETVRAPSWEKAYEKDFLITAYEKNIPVTVISTGMKRRIEKEYLGCEAKNIKVITNGTRICSGDYNTDKIAIIRQEFAIPEERKIGLCIGSICDRKNQMQILDALEWLQSCGKLNCVVFFCGVDTTDGLFEKQIKNKGLKNNAIKTGFIDRDHLNLLMDQADFNIVASRDEGFGLSIIEAYAHGLPSVAFQDLDAIENLYDEKAMLLAKERNTEALAAEIYNAASREWNTVYIKEMSSKFSLQKMAAEYEDEYSSILEVGGVLRLSLTYDYIRIQKLLGKNILVCVGNISENKNQIQAVRMMNHIDHAVLFVAGSESDGGSIRNYIREHKLSDKVIMMGFCDDVAQIWLDADLNLFLSKNDGFGLSVIEGYMYGVPSVMFADLDAAEDVSNNISTILPQNRADEMVLKAVRQGLNTDWNKSDIQSFAKMFSLERMAEQYVDLYSSQT